MSRLRAPMPPDFKSRKVHTKRLVKSSYKGLFLRTKMSLRCWRCLAKNARLTTQRALQKIKPLTWQPSFDQQVKKTFLPPFSSYKFSTWMWVSEEYEYYGRLVFYHASTSPPCEDDVTNPSFTTGSYFMGPFSDGYPGHALPKLRGYVSTFHVCGLG